jgi:NAD(P)-dependent dehydrogenase (short-subunit alcohol dehydrogenase family)
MGNEPNTVLLIGASRGLGHALAAEFLKRDWSVTGTVRPGSARTPLHDLAGANPGQLEVEALDVNQPDQVAALRRRLAGRVFPVLFVNAGVTGNDDMPIGQVPAADFAAVMTTNALSPMRVIEALEDLVTPDGLIGAMSSGQGSITNNTRGQHELYRGSKAALNMFMRSYAARQAAPGRALALLAPGWVRTGLGGDNAPYTIEETIPMVADVLLAKRQRPGLEYLDRFGQVIPW